MILTEIMYIIAGTFMRCEATDNYLDEVRPMPKWYLCDGRICKPENIELSTAKLKKLEREELNSARKHLKQKNERLKKDGDQMKTMGIVMIGVSLLTLLVGFFNPGNFPAGAMIFFGIIILIGGIILALSQTLYSQYYFFDKAEITSCIFPVDTLYTSILKNRKGMRFSIQFAQCGQNQIRISNDLIERGGTNDELYCTLAEYKGKVYFSITTLV